MGCAKTSRITEPVIKPNEKFTTFSPSKPNKLIKPIEQTLQKVISVQKEINPNDSLYKLIEKLTTFRNGFKKNNSEFEKAFALIQKILKNISSDFSNEKFKTITKKNQKFHEAIGKYPSGLDLLKLLGFQEKGEVISFTNTLPRSYVQMKIIDLNIAYNKISC